MGLCTLGRNERSKVHRYTVSHFGKARKSFSFEYDKDWISSQEQMLLDPDLGWYTGHTIPKSTRTILEFSLIQCLIPGVGL